MVLLSTDDQNNIAGPIQRRLGRALVSTVSIMINKGVIVESDVDTM